MLIGLYCDALDRKDAVFPRKFGTSDTTPHSKSAHTHAVCSKNPLLFASLAKPFSSCLFFCINAIDFCGSIPFSFWIFKKFTSFCEYQFHKRFCSACTFFWTSGSLLWKSCVFILPKEEPHENCHEVPSFDWLSIWSNRFIFYKLEASFQSFSSSFEGVLAPFSIYFFALS